MEDYIKFFETKNVASVLKNFMSLFRNIQPNNEFESERNYHIRSIISSMVDEPNKWDYQCQVNIKFIGEGFESDLSKGKISKKDEVDSVYISCYRFLLEYYLRKLQKYNRLYNYKALLN